VNDTDQESNAVAISGVQANVAEPVAFSVFGDAEANAEQSNDNSAEAKNENRTAQSIDQSQGVGRAQKVHRDRWNHGPRRRPHHH
jgi:hypothetical protein